MLNLGISYIIEGNIGADFTANLLSGWSLKDQRNKRPLKMCLYLSLFIFNVKHAV